MWKSNKNKKLENSEREYFTKKNINEKKENNTKCQK